MTCRLLHTYPGGWQIYLAPDGQEPQLLTVLVRQNFHLPYCTHPAVVHVQRKFMQMKQLGSSMFRKKR